MRPNGYDWCWFPTRLAIYARDGWACLACGREAGERRLHRLSLDHVRALSDGGHSRASNLITLCVGCNSQRGSSPLATWRPDLVDIVRSQTRRRLDRVSARALAAELRPARFAAHRARSRRGPLVVEGVPF